MSTDISLENLKFDSDHVIINENNTTLKDALEPVLLWPATESTAAITSMSATATVTLNDSVLNYRYIYFEYKFNSSSNVLWTYTLPVAALSAVGIGSARTQIYGIRNGAYTTRFSRNFSWNSTGTVMTGINSAYNNKTTSATGYTLLYRIYGIK